MIRNIHIKNFKSHADTNLALTNLNLFTGMNGMGKSSVIQTLLLLRQTFQKNMLDKGLELKGRLCSLGTAYDALYELAEEDCFTFSLNFGNNQLFNWEFHVDMKKASSATYVKLKGEPIFINHILAEKSLFNNHFQYISAFRNGPKQDYEKDTSTVELFHQMSQKEGRCELIAHYLDYFKYEKISHHSLQYDDNNKNEDLIYQTSQWLQEISPNIDIRIKANETSYRLNYQFSRGRGEFNTAAFKAYNVGFGISYALPIIVAALHSPKDSLVIVENPEAHLHPEGQVKMMELIAKAAKAGVQFIIETHSDHIMNSLLVSVKRQIINPDEVSVYHFDRNTKMHETRTTHLPVLAGGRIKRPPKGFFDRIDKDLDILMGME